MEELIINCKTSEETRRRFTPEEVATREADMAEAVVDEESRQKKLKERQDAIKRLRETETGRDVLATFLINGE